MWTRAEIDLVASVATCPQDRELAAAEMVGRSHSRVSASRRPTSREETSLGGTTIPCCGEVIILRTAPTSVATTGVPQAKASLTTFGHPSLELARQKTSAAAIRVASSFC